jgi:Mrp family chromosome partitioning ATPase
MLFIIVCIGVMLAVLNVARPPKLYYRAEASIIFLGKEGTFVPELEIKKITDKDFLKQVYGKVSNFSPEDISGGPDLKFEKEGRVLVSLVSEDPAAARDVVSEIGYLFTESRKREIDAIVKARQKTLQSLSDDVAMLESNLNSVQKKLRNMKHQYLEADQRRNDFKVMLDKLKFEHQQMLKVFTDRHPDVVSLENRISSLEAQLNSIPDKSQEYISLDTVINKVESELARKKNEYEQTYNSFKQEPAPWRAELEKEVAMPFKPLGDNRRLYYIWVIFASLFTGIIVSLLTELTDDKVHSAEEAEKKLSIPVISEIGKVPIINKTKKHGNILAKIMSYHQGNFMPAKKIEQLYTFLKMESFKGEISNSKILFTGADSNSGKSFLACYFALVAAMNGDKVLLTDANFYSPSLNKIFNLDKDTKGFSDLLRGTISKKESVKNLTDLLLSGTLKVKDSQISSLDNLKILLSGSKVAKPFSLMGLSDTKQLLKELSRDYGMIVMVLPNAVMHPDALNMLPAADCILLVVKKHRTKYSSLRNLIKKCDNIGARPAGMVFTNV